MVQDMLAPSKGYRWAQFRPQDVTPQLNLLVLRANGMDKLREVRVPNVKFTSLVHGSREDIAVAECTSGPICRGTLQTIVAKEIMRPTQLPTPITTTSTELPKMTTRWPKRKANLDSDDEYTPSPGSRNPKRTRLEARAPGTRRILDRAAKASVKYLSSLESEPELESGSGMGAVTKTEVEITPKAEIEIKEVPYPSRQTFRLLDLPAELRNLIYRHLLIYEGAINPSRRVPTSHHRSGKSIAPSALYRPGVAPSSCLAILQANKQTYDEAVGIFYGENSFVFYYPNQLMMFLLSISEHRKRYIERVTLWYKNHHEGDINSIDVNLMALKNLKNLKRLEVVLEYSVIHNFVANPGPYGWRMPGEQLLKEMTISGVKIVLRSQQLDHYFWMRNMDGEHRSGMLHEMNQAKKAIDDLMERVGEAPASDAERVTESDDQGSD